MSGSEGHDAPSEVSAEGGAVIVEGPDGVNVTLTPAAAYQTGKRLQREAGTAAGQHKIGAEESRLTAEGESQLDTVRRHVAEGKTRLERQERIIAHLREDGHPTEAAEQIHATMTKTQRLNEDHLARLTGRPAGSDGGTSGH